MARSLIHLIWQGAAVLFLVMGMPLAANNSASAEETSPTDSLLKANRIEATPEGMRTFLAAIYPVGTSPVDTRLLIRQLGDNKFQIREDATAKLLALTRPPIELLKEAAASNDLEVRSRAKAILRRLQDGVSPDPLLFAAFTTIRDRKIVGLTDELLRAIPACSRKPVRQAAEQALCVTVQAEDRERLTRAANEGAPAVRSAARAALRGGDQQAFDPLGWVEFFDSYLVRGQYDGEVTEFVKELPGQLSVHFRRVTRNANTINSVDSRHDTAPWLYPTRGKNEAPRILVEPTARYYPIWGQWRQHWGNWVRHDENGAIIEGESGGGAHLETEVDYYTVPQSLK